jgi:hypothetical protein
MQEEKVLLAHYWDSDEAYPGRLSDGSDPATGAVFRSLFGPDQAFA